MLCDIERYAEWAPWTLHARRVDRPAGLGVAYEEHGRVLSPLVGPSRWRIVEFDVPRRQVHRAEAVRLAVAFDRIFELTSDGTGGTWLSLCCATGRRSASPAAGSISRSCAGCRRAGSSPALDGIGRLAERAPGPMAVP